jgi:hypothetical protein
MYSNHGDSGQTIKNNGCPGRGSSPHPSPSKPLRPVSC